MEQFALKPVITFGRGALAALERLPGERVMVVTDGFLAQSGLSVEEIGRRVGIFDPSYFWRSFRRETGYSPSAYRRRMSAKEK